MIAKYSHTLILRESFSIENNSYLIYYRLITCIKDIPLNSDKDKT